MKRNSPVTIVDQFVIPHTAFVNAEQQIRQSFAFSGDNAEAEGVAIVGESGTGKTSVLDSFRSNYPPTLSKEGWEVPILSATVPPHPTVKSLAGVMLAALRDPTWEQGTEPQKSKRLRVLMKGTGTRMVMIDEFQHFYNQDKQKIMYDVADWLKVLIDDTHSVLVVAGLPSCTSVINQNQQLRRRFLAPVQLSRFRWEDLRQRREFMGILKEFNTRISKGYEITSLHIEEMAFRFYCATGGLISLLAKILRQAVRNAIDSNKASIDLEDLNIAHVQAIYSSETDRARLKPFESGFALVQTVDILDRVSKIGTVIEISPSPTRRRLRKTRSESLDAILTTR
jgi:hypothetical protein